MTGKRRVASTMVWVALGFLIGCSGGKAPEPTPTQTDPRFPPLFEDLGSHHRAITTSSEMAQKYFDQGLRLIYGFNHDEAERAFLEAARLDPGCAMAWWGAAVALGPNINLPLDAARNERALDAVGKAQPLAESQASEVERALIAAVATRYSSDPKADRTRLDHDYAAAMKSVSERYPDDNDAAVLYAESLMDLKPWQLWKADGKPQEGTDEILRVLESVLARNPNHPGANHYYIHAVEASPRPERASASAERLRTLVPGAGHLVHMPAHIQMRLGNYAGAKESNENAARVDEAYIARTKAEGVYPMMYYTHNLMFLSAAAGMEGQSTVAIESAAKAVAIAAPMAAHEPMAEYVLPWSLFAMERFRKWDDILAAARPADSTPSTLAFWFYARGLAHIAKGDLKSAREDRNEFTVASAKAPKDFMLNLNRAGDLHSIALAVLDARLSAARGDGGAALTQWQKAIEVQDRLNYDEPPAWYYPVRESLGGEYLRLKRYAEAERVFRRDLELNPNSGRSLFGLREALRGQSKDDADTSRKFDEAWKRADITLSVDSL